MQTLPPGGGKPEEVPTKSAVHHRIFLDCTETVRLGGNTGIQRAVRSIVGEGAKLSTGTVACVPVSFDGSCFVQFSASEVAESVVVGREGVTWREWLRRFSIHGAKSALLRASILHPAVVGLARRGVSALHWSTRRLFVRRAPRSGRIEYVATDWVVLLDSTWGPDLRPELLRAKAQGARVCVLIYDLIQIRCPDLVSPGAGIIFQRWFERVLPLTDRFVTISRAVRDDLLAYLRETGHPQPMDDRVGWIHLGCDFHPAPGQGSATAEVLAMFDSEGSPAFVSVGTLEKRKEQTTILDAFEKRWSSGDRSRLILVGREGWGSHALTQRLRRHPELGRRLFWLHLANDTDLEWCYRHATAVIIASIHEGFGLPIVEALQRGVAVIASDIPVFREVGGDRVTFVAPGDVDALADAIAKGGRGQLKRPNPGQMDSLSWHGATHALISQLEIGA